MNKNAVLLANCGWCSHAFRYLCI